MEIDKEKHLAKYDDLDLMIEAASSIQFEQLSVLKDFAAALAKTHPNPDALLAQFEAYRAEAREDELPFTELTPANQLARENGHIHEQALIRLLRARIEPAA